MIQVVDPEILPPRALLLAPEVLQLVGQEPARAFALSPCLAVLGKTRGQPVEDGLDIGGPFLDCLARISALVLGPCDLRPAAFQLGAPLLQPVAKGRRGQAVVPVVRLNGSGVLGSQLVGAPELQGPVDPPQGSTGRGQLQGPVESEELLQRLQGVALDARAHAMAGHGEEVYKPLGAEEPVQLRLPGPVAADQALHRSRLVRGEVIHVHARMGLPPVHDEVDEILDGPALSGRIQPPQGPVPAGSTRIPAGTPCPRHRQTDRTRCRRRHRPDPAQGVGRIQGPARAPAARTSAPLPFGRRAGSWPVRAPSRKPRGCRAWAAGGPASASSAYCVSVWIP